MAPKKAKAATGRGTRRHQTLIQRSRAIAPSAKATFHQVAGAGRSHVRRQFFGLTPADEDTITNRVRQGLEQALKEA